MDEFKEVCTDRGATHAAIYEVLSSGKTRKLAFMGNDSISCNGYSMTKSLVGLLIFHDVLYNGYDVEIDVTGILRFLSPKIIISKSPVTLSDLLHHTAGLNPIHFEDPTVLLDLLFRRNDTRAIIEDYLREASGGSHFNYSPVLGYMLAGAVYELDKRRTNRCFSIREECARLFFPEGMSYWEWQTCKGADICNHTYAYSEFKTDGEGMKHIGVNLLVKHRRLLEFILDWEKPSSMYVRNARSSSASAGNIDSDKGGEIMLNYDYSGGMWVLQKQRVVVAIGLAGQYLVLSLDQNLVGVRKQTEIFSKSRTTYVGYELTLKKSGMFVNTHESFPLLVHHFKTKGAERDMERSLLFTAREVVDYQCLLEFAKGKTQTLSLSLVNVWKEIRSRLNSEMNDIEKDYVVWTTFIEFKKK